MDKDTRNTVTAYLLFVYGCIIIPVFLISFESGAYGVNLIPVLAFTVIISLISGMLFYNLKIQMRYNFRIFMYLCFITAVNIFTWFMICDGTFIFRE
ncbi:MAG: hypothetical protein ACHQNT_04985 [Bacteroidia bacterium]